MSILFPDRHGYNGTDQRLTLDITSNNGFLRSAHGLLMMQCGNPLLNQDYYGEFVGGSNVGLILFGNTISTSPGYFACRFNGWGHDTTANRNKFEVKFNPNGGSQVLLSVYSPVVTLDNCEFVAIERVNDSYAIHLIAADGTVTAGTFVAHSTGSLGLTSRSGAHTIYFGGATNDPTLRQNTYWRNEFGNLMLVESASALTDTTAAMGQIARGASPVDQFGAATVLIWRTIQDLTSNGLAAHATATADTFPAMGGSAGGAALSTARKYSALTNGVTVTERKHNFHGVHAGQATGSIKLKGQYIGTVAAVEAQVRLKSDNSIVSAWAVVDAAPASFNWAGTIAGLAPGIYTIEARVQGSTDVFVGTNEHVVGYVMALKGQSQLAIAWDGDPGATTLPDVTANGPAYMVGWDSGKNIIHPAAMKFGGKIDYSASLLMAQAEWEQDNPGVPVIWAKLSAHGTSLDNWAGNSAFSGSVLFGDGTTFLSGLETSMRIALNTDVINIVWQWGTSDMTNVDYATDLSEYVKGGGVGNNLAALYQSPMPIALSPFSRHTASNATDNYTGDPVIDNYGNVSTFRVSQISTFQSVFNDRRLVVGPSTSDMLIEAAGGPHQPGLADSTRFTGGSPRLGGRLGQAAARLVQASPAALPAIASVNYNDVGQTQIRVTMANVTTLKTNDLAAVAGFEVEDNGVWNRKGFSAAVSGNSVIITKDSGAFVAAKVRYLSGGPLSYGTSYTAEMDADIDRLLYDGRATVDARGVMVNDSSAPITVGAYITDTDYTSGGITWSVAGDGHVTGLYPNGERWIVGPVTVNSITPGNVLESGKILSGSMIDIGDGIGTQLQGFDQRKATNPTYDAAKNVTLPLSIAAGRILVSAKSYTASELTAKGYDLASDDPSIEQHQTLTVLASAPAATAFRPPLFQPTIPIAVTTADINPALLPKLAAPNGGVNTPDWAFVRNTFDYTRVWLSGAWYDRYMHADLAFPNPTQGAATAGNYGREIAKTIEQAAMSLMLNYPDAEKLELLTPIVQYAVDMVGFLKAGGVFNADGGHNMGRKLVLLIAAKVTGNAEFLTYCDGSLKKFQEDQQVFTVTADDVTRTNGGTWAPDSRDVDRGTAIPYRTADIGKVDWGIRHHLEPLRDNKHWEAYYRENAFGSMAGTALAARLMNQVALYNNAAFFEYMDYHVARQPLTAIYNQGTNGLKPFTLDMWNAYRHIGASS